MNIKFKVTGIEEVKAYIASLPRGIKMTATKAAAEYMIGDDSHGLKHQPARVQHGADNPYQWTSEKQRRAFFATNGFGGGIPSQRTGALKEGWDYQATNSQWDRVNITNDTPYAQFVQGQNMQRGHLADKWRNIIDVVATNTAGALQAAKRAVADWLKTK
jgi:hypothetical protein